MDIKRVGSGLLMQTADNHELTLADLKVVTKVQPTAEPVSYTHLDVYKRQPQHLAQEAARTQAH